MKVVVPALGVSCPAALALDREGIGFELVTMENDLSYSELLTELWKEGEDFIVIEHDVIPFNGALAVLDSCGEPWCAHWYDQGRVEPALGCCRFSGSLMRSFPDLWRSWENAPWWELDGKVYPAITRVTGLRLPHRHLPDFSHMKGI